MLDIENIANFLTLNNTIKKVIHMTNKIARYPDTSAIDAEIAATEAALAAAKSTFSSTPVANSIVSPPITEPAIETSEIIEKKIVEIPPTLVRQFNRQTFFAGYKKAFGGLTQSQVAGLNALLSSLEQDAELPYCTYMAYMLATLKHETANTFHPITEYGRASYFDKYDPVLANTATRRRTAIRNGNTQKGDGYTYRGRGFVQITWKNNYKCLGEAIGCDLVNNPELALDTTIAYKIMSFGMRTGVFTGKKFSDYLSKNKADYYSARRIINSLDRASTIKSYAICFEKILKNSISH